MYICILGPSVSLSLAPSIYVPGVHTYLPPFCLHKSINLAQFASHAVASFSALHLLKHCKLYAAHPTALPAGPDADASFFASHPQHFFGSSVFTSTLAHA